MNVRIKLLHPNARMPSYAHEGDAGCDLSSLHAETFGPHQTRVIELGIAIELPDGYEAQIRPRSSISKQGWLVHTGTIDAGFRGQLSATVTNTWDCFARLDQGRIAQLVIAPVTRAAFEVADELGVTVRGAGGFGSTGL